MTWILITREKANVEIAFIWLALPALIALITTPPFASRMELTSQRSKAFWSLILRVMGLIFMALLLGGVSQHYSIEVIVAMALMIGFVSVLDSVIHAPVPFLLANQLQINLVRFRVSLMLLIRGANVVTPTVALLFLMNIEIAVYYLIVAGFLSLASFGVMFVMAEHHAGPASRDATTAKRNIVLIYSVLLFFLNAVFGHVTAIMLAYHARAGHEFAYFNFSFFSGFLVASIALFVTPSLLSAASKSMNATMGGIALSLTVIGLSFGAVILTGDVWGTVPIAIAGITYGVNLHLVTTILPTFLGLGGLYKNLNYGKIGATIGGLISGAWVALITTAHTNLDQAFMMLAIGAFVLAAMIMGVKILHFRQSD